MNGASLALGLVGALALVDLFRRGAQNRRRYYHVTTKEAAEDILVNGFLPGWGDVGFGVYFYGSPESAKSYAARGGWDRALTGEHIVILSVEDVRIRKISDDELDASWSKSSYADMYILDAKEDLHGHVRVDSVALFLDLGPPQAGSRAPIDILGLIEEASARRTQKPRAAAPPPAPPPAPVPAPARPAEAAAEAAGVPLGGFVTLMDGDRKVRVTRHRDGQWSCTCPAWRRAGPACAHLEQVWAGARPVAGAARQQRTAERPAAATQGAGQGPWAGVMKAERWSPKIDPTGHLMSEKLDGYRAYWDGRSLYSKNGNRFAAPAWFTAGLPRGTPLDGELYLGPGRLDETGSILRRKVPDPRWSAITFRVFDAPTAPGGFAARHRAAQAAVEAACAAYAGPGACPYALVQQVSCQGPAHLARFHQAIVARGGEGTVLRDPQSPYIRSRSHHFLKHKDKHDAEAKVVGHEWSKTNPGQLGAYKVKDLETGASFEIGIGIEDAQRKRPLPIGSVVTYAYRDKTSSGVPRGAILVRERRPE